MAWLGERGEERGEEDAGAVAEREQKGGEIVAGAAGEGVGDTDFPVCASGARGRTDRTGRNACVTVTQTFVSVRVLAGWKNEAEAKLQGRRSIRSVPQNSRGAARLTEMHPAVTVLCYLPPAAPLPIRYSCPAVRMNNAPSITAYEARVRSSNLLVASFTNSREACITVPVPFSF